LDIKWGGNKDRTPVPGIERIRRKREKVRDTRGTDTRGRSNPYPWQKLHTLGGKTAACHHQLRRGKGEFAAA